MYIFYHKSFYITWVFMSLKWVDTLRGCLWKKNKCNIYMFFYLTINFPIFIFLQIFSPISWTSVGRHWFIKVKNNLKFWNFKVWEVSLQNNYSCWLKWLHFKGIICIKRNKIVLNVKKMTKTRGWNVKY